MSDNEERIAMLREWLKGDPTTVPVAHLEQALADERKRADELALRLGETARRADGVSGLLSAARQALADATRERDAMERDRDLWQGQLNSVMDGCAEAATMLKGTPGEGERFLSDGIRVALAAAESARAELERDRDQWREAARTNGAALEGQSAAADKWRDLAAELEARCKALPCRASTVMREDRTICTEDHPCDICALPAPHAGSLLAAHAREVTAKNARIAELCRNCNQPVTEPNPHWNYANPSPDGYSCVEPDWRELVSRLTRDKALLVAAMAEKDARIEQLQRKVVAYRGVVSEDGKDSTTLSADLAAAGRQAPRQARSAGAAGGVQGRKRIGAWCGAREGKELMPDYKPSQIRMTIPPFVGAFDKCEVECAAGLLVHVLSARGDEWRAIVWDEVESVIKDDLADERSEWAKLVRNPFCQPDFVTLVKRGLAKWEGTPGDSSLSFTDSFFERIQKWVAKA